VTFVVRVVAVPERASQAQALAASVNGQVVMDEHHDGAFANHLRALASVADATHVVVLEDDAIPCADFLDHVAEIIAERPDDLLGLYVGRTAPKQPQPLLEELTSSGMSWLDHPELTDRLRWAVGYVMPAVDVPAVLEHAPKLSTHPWLHTDVRIGSLHASQGRLSYPFPSLVEHNDELPSMTSTHRRGRVAWHHCERNTL
jgi:hypothetical protein